MARLYGWLLENASRRPSSENDSTRPQMPISGGCEVIAPAEPTREDLAFLLERDDRLGGRYAGVLVDYTQAGVEHSLRWDVLPVRIWAGKQ